MPATHVPWRSVFGNERRVEVEIGPGRGEVLLASAATRRDVNFFAIERHPAVAEVLSARVARAALHNVRTIAADARLVIAHLVPDESVTAYHIYFPDPWPKTRHRRRRLVTDDAAHHFVRTLVPGGAVHLASDLEPLLEAFVEPLMRSGLVRLVGAAPASPRPVTCFERRYGRSGTHYTRLIRPRTARIGAPAPVAGDD